MAIIDSLEVVGEEEKTASMSLLTGGLEVDRGIEIRMDESVIGESILLM